MRESVVEVLTYVKVNGDIISLDLLQVTPKSALVDEGSIEISVYGAVFLPSKYIDNLIELWGYFLGGLQKLAKENDAWFAFPSNAIVVRMKKRGERLDLALEVFGITERTMQCNYTDFMDAVKNEAHCFVKTFTALTSARDFSIPFNAMISDIYGQ